MSTIATARRRHEHYIPSIDGLRALSVLGVVLYHLDPRLLPGGFVGVDIFFVISGYVVSTSLGRDQRRPFLSFALSFYARRMLRILPALVVCLLLISLLSALLIPRAWLSDSSDKTGLLAFFGISNFALVLLNDGYFSPRVEFNPFTHTWSLGVEEQFYLLFPLLFFYWLRFHDCRGLVGLSARTLLATLLIGSLAYAWWATSRHPDWAFYLLPSRFWELASGALLFQLQQRGVLAVHHGRDQSLLIALGFGLVLFAFGWSDTNAFPFPWALAADAGALLLLAAVTKVDQCATADRGRKPVLQRLLELPAVGHVGKISYSLYLWHWPIAVLMRWTSGLETRLQLLVALLLSLLFAELSFRWIEQPIRRNSWSRRQPHWKTVILGLLSLSLACLGASAIFAARPNLSLSVTRDQEIWYPDPWPSPATSRTRQWTGKQLFVVGDSHAGAYHTMLHRLSNEHGLRVFFYFTGDCPIASLQDDGSTARTDCAAQVEHHLHEIKAQAQSGDLVLLASLRVRRFADQFAVFPLEQVLAIRDAASARETRKQAVEAAFELIKRFQTQGLEVIIDAPKPVFRAPVFRCADWFNRHNPVCDEGLTMKREQLLEHRAGTMKALNELKQLLPDLHVWDPFPILCPSDICSAFDDGQPLFFDADHLSGYGNQRLYPDFEILIGNIIDADRQ